MLSCDWHWELLGAYVFVWNTVRDIFSRARQTLHIFSQVWYWMRMLSSVWQWVHVFVWHTLGTQCIDFPVLCTLQMVQIFSRAWHTVDIFSCARQAKHTFSCVWYWMRMLSRVWHRVYKFWPRLVPTRRRTNFRPAELNIWPYTSFTRDRHPVHTELWSTMRLNFRTVKVVPCERNT